MFYCENMGGIKKKRNNRNNKKNKIKKANKLKAAYLASKKDNKNEQEQEIGQQINTEDRTPIKRLLDDNDSDDNEDVPKKKKKRNAHTLTQDSSDKKGKKSIRQMKRERYLQRQAEAEFAAKDQLKSQCLTYLSQWKHDKTNWKFMKAKQVWLYKNKFLSNLIPDESWPLLLEYFESAQGNIRNMLLEDANKVIKQMDDWTESQPENSEEKAVDDDGDKVSEIKKPDDTKYKRARDIIQCLQ